MCRSWVKRGGIKRAAPRRIAAQRVRFVCRRVVSYRAASGGFRISDIVYRTRAGADKVRQDGRGGVYVIGMVGRETSGAACVSGRVGA